ncbi:MAG: helix-turn-helix domain-containing protein [Candidatus Cryptobacteroides sp.]
MKAKLPFVKWREKVQNIVPPHNRLGDDLLLIEDKYWDPGDEPFIADITYSIILLKGWSEMSINLKKYHIDAPAMVVILPGMITQAFAHSEDMESFSIVMSPTFFNPLFNEMGINSIMNSNIFLNPVSVIDWPDVFLNYRDMLKRILSAEGCRFKMEAARHLTLTMFYGYTLSMRDISKPMSKNRNDEISNKFLDLVQTHFAEIRDVASYADKLCITPKYLAMAVKSSTGKTPLEWIDDYLSSAAKAMLSSTNLSVNEISEKLNFSSQSLFGKYFKRINGISPREYRNNLVYMEKSAKISE